ncbi:MAG: hypothetical protein PWQ13_205 [Bacillota bacterium]|nr:hypothetical protein [Bacillota bacterium]
MAELGIGIIGLGRFSRVIAQALSDTAGLRLVAAADVSAEQRAAFASEFPPLKVYEKIDALVADPAVDVIIVAAPPYLHAELGRKVLAGGKHLFLEKPGALEPQDLAELARFAKAHGLRTGIDFVMRRNPLYFLLHTFAEKGLFGLPERAYLENYAHDDHLLPGHWFWDREKSGGIWIEHGVHFLDIANWLLGPAEWAWASDFARPEQNLVERVVGTVRHKNGCPVSYYHGFTKPEPFEHTVFNLVWERAYAALDGWIPVRLTLDALVTPEIEDYLTGKILAETRDWLPDIGVKIEECTVEPLGRGEVMLRGRGNTFKVTARLKISYALEADRWTVYRASVRRGLLELAAAVGNPARHQAVTLSDAEAALQVAAALTESAASGRPVLFT